MKAAIMGYGTIGSGVAEILEVNKKVIAQRIGEPLELKYILDLREFPGDPNEDKVIKDYMTIANDDEVKVVVETMGGVEPAYTFVKAMLENGKSVTTSNKALVADKGAELLEIAKIHNTSFMFEAAVGGGIPCIRTITTCLTGDVIEKIQGIVNGTTNYMMTKMTNEGLSYDDVLKEAQAKGYAEKDPTADVEGFDACRKIAILTSLAAGQQVNFEEIPTEGISKISSTDIQYAKALGKKVKLIATAQRVGDTYVARVAPFMIGPENTLYTVEDVFNAVTLCGNMLGESMYYGAGAGKLPTASAVVGDMVYLGKHVGKHVPITWAKTKLELADADDQSFEYFVRANASDAEIENTFGKVDFINELDVDNEAGFIVPMMTERQFKERCNALDGQVLSVIRLG